MAKKIRTKQQQLVVHKIDAGTWSVQKKAVPGFRLSKSTMASKAAQQGTAKLAK